MNIVKPAVTAILLAAIPGALVTAAATAAADVTCYGDYCSGRDPNQTRCAQDAKTIAAKHLQGSLIEVRYSPTCKTNWARYEQYPVGARVIGTAPLVLRAVQDTGYEQHHDFGLNGADPGTYVTPMIYSPVHKVYAEVLFQCGGMSLVETAFDCATSSSERTDAV
ncbi:DUF2690 domain-containing protein [Nocardia arizonensis]|uniref:DUF2690 domain-containing protein n=1 Tax=Nocardia arizonensis TaxID=1141647 RepID=UPI0006D1B94E|nr:DUF2690 domain-containing protein [Nocardia arizonensis]